MTRLGVNPDGIAYGPTASGKSYISLFYHRRLDPKRQKNCWNQTVPPPAEYALFEDADARNWTDPIGNYWAFGDRGRRVLGRNGERLAKFPRTTNPGDPWHGYPVSPAEDYDDTPPDDLVNRWIASEAIEKTTGRRIQRHKL